MASSEYYEGEVKKERKREIGASYRTKSDIKKKEKALMDKAINLYAKELKERFSTEKMYDTELKNI